MGLCSNPSGFEGAALKSIALTSYTETIGASPSNDSRLLFAGKRSIPGCNDILCQRASFSAQGPDPGQGLTVPGTLQRESKAKPLPQRACSL